MTGIFWMVNNFFAIPLFGDTVEYSALSENLLLDEYRPILYPLFLRIVRQAASASNADYQCIVYSIQTVFSFLAIYYLILTLFRLMNVKLKKWYCLLLAMFIITIPMITWLNFTILTDSLACSALVFMLTKLTLYVFDKDTSLFLWIQVAFAYIVQSLLRADRKYSCIVFILLVILVKAIKEKKVQVLMPIFICFLAVLFVNITDAKTQVPGRQNRITTNLQFVLLDRIVWGNMANNYDYFSKEIRSAVTLEDAETFDQSNNNAMYQMAPLLNEKFGVEGARRIETEMALVVFHNQPIKILTDIFEDVFAFFFIPWTAFGSHFHLVDSSCAWNIYCMSSAAEWLTHIYNYLFIFGYCMVFFPLSLIFFFSDRNLRQHAIFLKLYFAMALVLSLWFGLGDGAPPNDRYTLLMYLMWGMLTEICFFNFSAKTRTVPAKKNI